MMYFESSYPNFIYAVDLDNIGRMVWKFAPEQDKLAPRLPAAMWSTAVSLMRMEKFLLPR
jgi:PQQ enzyme repeat